MRRKNRAMFGKKDLKSLSTRGISKAEAIRQIKVFKEGVRPINLSRAATLGDGIIQLGADELSNYASLFEKERVAFQIGKFTPASGAASRMFKALFNCLNAGKVDSSEVIEFIDEIDNFAFSSLIPSEKKSGALQIIDFVLNQEPLAYRSKPKGLIEFHKYSDSSLVPVEEHIYEGAQILGDDYDLHLTLSPQHVDMVLSRIEAYLKRTGLQVRVKHSIQESSTDTIAVDLNNIPYRDSNQNLLFRPGGHGALLANLNKLEFDFVFIKNIDNVTHQSRVESTIRHKKALGGFLIEKIRFIHEQLQYFKAGNETNLVQIAKQEFSQTCNTEEEAFIFLNRPIRICGMVKNEGEPGGGPFWVESVESQGLQIVEKAQINQEDAHQGEIMQNSTHFNPVDLVCFKKSFDGSRFNLFNFVDQRTALISKKSIAGKTVKALEHPGLWNGSMAKWLTYFIEVPIDTFNPVKTVNDLLKDGHQYV